jgi:hypothetical protein
MSFTDSLRGPDEDEVLTDYGDDDSSKFGEDGSFIGQYVPKRKPPEAPAPPAMHSPHAPGTATFV